MKRVSRHYDRVIRALELPLPSMGSRARENGKEPITGCREVRVFFQKRLQHQPGEKQWPLQFAFNHCHATLAKNYIPGWKRRPQSMSRRCLRSTISFRVCKTMASLTR